MKVFISGATGFIGSKLALKLAGEGHTIHALYRSEKKAEVLKHHGIKLFKGDILDPESLKKAMYDCELVYHTAAYTSVWEKDHSRIYHLNIEGTINIIHAAIFNKIKRIVCTSTAGVLGASGPDRELDENSPPPEHYFIDYENSKAILEKILKLISLKGPEIIIVNPSRVYGPGILSESNGVTRMVDKYIKGKWHFIPGNGKSIGNYVHIDDVVQGHILAMEKGKNGERYILGAENISYNDFFKIIRELSDKNYSLFKIPLFLMLFAAKFMIFIAYLFNTKPLITPSLVKKFNMDFIISSDKAKKELTYSPMSLKSGLENTIKWLEENKIYSDG